MVKLSNKSTQAISIQRAYLKNGIDFKLENSLDGLIIPTLTNNFVSAKIVLNAKTVGIKYDTLIIIVQYPYCTDTLIAFISANLSDLSFTIRASEHKLVNPNSKDYSIPIYITSNISLSDINIYIDKAVIEIDRNIFLPKSVDNGTLLLKTINNSRYITLSNLTLPELVEGKETLLCNIRGDVLLESVDSSAITIDSVKFSDNIKLEELDIVNGYITLDICHEGGDRLLLQGDVPYVHVVVNPAKTMLYVRCQALEAGEHSLEIADVLGGKTEVKKWNVSLTGERLFEYEIPITNYSEGTYTIIMHTPTAKETR